MSEVFEFERDTDRYRLAMGVEYRGTAYRGWQIQRSGVPTIQAELEAAVSVVANEPVASIVAGRTDAGVHATNQVVHFDTQSDRSEYGWKMGINGRLPDDISIRWVKLVDTGFHARFSAKERAYRFVIHNNWVKSALLHSLTTWERYELDVDLMQQAADLLLGKHDFSSFRAAECQAHSPVRTLKELQVRRFGEFVVLQARADGFLHHMVRNLVGVLLPIGRGRKPVEWAREVLQYQDRTKGGVTAQGDGLYFIRAQYERDDLPVMDAGPGFIQPLIDNLPNNFSRV
ncbi:tRNA pseudouridine(38-40) synthase TruA [Reinekea marinisedimentorum]|uniref:tRNA pseudouridine synthase A n=1 Tax=Reinekea marinisedimentorum TaxID=230495 RepID=A0A4R3I877_9GAMM|nr:tRNA pseudouridine(38-40) synthase TruA [Reinekea marinisedimentorum]TCS41442.1 tRNA pseudouridine38-40 synthase [Reinekea marinisedimentorum]